MKKRIIYIALMVITSYNLMAQTNQNYVRTHSYITPRTTLPTEAASLVLPNNDVSINTQYVDGLGRPIQSITKQGSVTDKDIVQHMEYDAFGRQIKTFLPYTGGNSGLYTSGASSGQNSFYDSQFGGTSGNYAFSENDLEASPLNRVLKTYAPGQPWSIASGGGNKPMEYQYLVNDNTDHVFMWKIEEGFLMAYSFYEPGELYKTVTLDENTGSDEGEVIEFKNKQGQVILKRVKKNTSSYLETYYTYDDFGNLRYVLPPMASSNYGSIDLEAPVGYTLVTTDTTLLSSTNQKFAYIPSASVKIPTGLTMSTGFESVLHGVVPTQDFLDKWAFQYKYDGRQRMIEKKVPGAGWVYMIYDKRDRLVLTQDGNQRSSIKWSFTKYDVLDRPIITGEKVISGSLSSIRSAVSGVTVYHESYASAGLQKYTNVAYPTGIVDADINTVTYYDDYQYVSKSFIDPPSGRFTTEDHKIVPVDFTSVQGQVIGTKTKVLGTTNQYTETVNFYDDRYRLIQTQMTNHKGGDDVLTTQYDFAGRVRKTFMEFDNPSGDISSATIAQNYTYDHASRLLEVDHSIDGATPIVIVTNTYNELGELENKKLHEESTNVYAQSIDYAYNMRGWLTKMNDPSVTDPSTYFSMSLKYDNATSGHQAYNGNIGTIDWKNPLESTVNTYDYNYDNANRLKVADFASSSDPTSDHYDVSGIDYDDNGNIEKLIRNGQKTNGTMGAFDDLTYTYANGNQLSKVEDTSLDEKGFKNGVNQSTEYTYDENGNMKSDANKGITDITYNYLNLPERVEMSNGNYIEYVYDASGIKLQQIVHESGESDKTTDYLGGFIYEDNALQFIQHDEGRVVPNDGNWEYQYHLKDHLGNTRVTFTTEDIVIPFDATFEDGTNDAIFNEEAKYFFNMGNRVEYPYTTATDKAQGLNKNAPIGAGIMLLDMMAGDTLEISVKAYYEDATGFSNSTIGSSVFATGITNSTNTLNGGGETQQAAYNLLGAITVAAASVADGAPVSDTHPSAYLNYMVFDENSNLISAQSGFLRVDEQEDVEQTLSISDLILNQDGFVYVYLSNESNSDNFVYFDNLNVTVREISHILEYQNYYPFGLTFNAYNKAGMISQKFKYNGKEEINDLGVNWQDYGARMYDAAIGRFMTIDPLAEAMNSWTPYHYTYNSPVNFNDPTGMMPEEGGSNSDCGGDPLCQKQQSTDRNKEIFGRNWKPNYIAAGKSDGSSTPTIDLSNDPGTLALSDLYAGTPTGSSGPEALSFTGDMNIMGNTSQARETPRWLSIAEGQLGVTETRGPEHTLRVLQYLYSTDTGVPGADETAWCGAFCNWTMNKSGSGGLNSAQAWSLAWKNYGIKLSRPALGSIAIIDKGNGSGHVGFVAGVNTNGNIILLGGNQDNRVKYSSFPANRISSYAFPYIYLPNYNLPTIDVNGTSTDR